MIASQLGLIDDTIDRLDSSDYEDSAADEKKRL